MPRDLERSIRQVPTAIWSLLRNAGVIRTEPTTEGADAWAAQRRDELPTPDGPVQEAGARLLRPVGLYPMADETKGQFQDAVMGPPERWFPTHGLAQRARGIVPKDINLPDEGPDTAARWRAFAQQKGSR